MSSYWARRKRWHTRITGLDEGSVSAKIQADMLLERAGITEDQRLMVLASVDNELDFDEIITVMRKHHPSGPSAQDEAETQDG